MNLHGIVKGAIGAVNPFLPAKIYGSNGYGKNNAHQQIPLYFAPVTLKVQIQPLQYNDIVQLDGMNIQGTRRKIYIDGHWDGVVRIDNRGGDLLYFPDRPGGAMRCWLVVIVFEQFPDWSSLGVTLQTDVSEPVPAGQLDGTDPAQSGLFTTVV